MAITNKALPVYLDGQNPNLGRYSACRRVTRTIYLSSAPLQKAANRGLEDRRIKLGCTQPGENVATFGDALRRLTDQATYLYVDNNHRYWISTQPNVTRTAQDRAIQIQQEQQKVWDEIIKRLKNDKERGEFAGVHVAPHSSADVLDDESMGVKLVILHPQSSHSNKVKNTTALEEAERILNTKGASPRYCKNLLVFLASDRTKLENLTHWVCQYLAWESIVADKDVLNLDAFQNKQATAKRKESDETVDMLLRDTYQWLLVPTQPESNKEIEWEENRLQTKDSPIKQASNKLIHEECLITKYAPSRLTLEILKQYVWKDSNHIDLKTLWKYLSNYLYFPRLKNQQVLLDTISEGVGNLLWDENFAYATGWDEAKQRYLNLKTAEHIKPDFSSSSLLVKPDVAQKQLELQNIQNTNIPTQPTKPDYKDNPSIIDNKDTLPLPPVQKKTAFLWFSRVKFSATQ